MSFYRIFTILTFRYEHVILIITNDDELLQSVFKYKTNINIDNKTPVFKHTVLFYIIFIITSIIISGIIMFRLFIIMLIITATVITTYTSIYNACILIIIILIIHVT